jgi:Grx4 family monothiol glutaredoxin
MSTLTEIPTAADWEQLVASLPASTLHIIYFHAHWAAPCENITKVLQTLAADHPVTDPPKTQWSSINAEDLDDITEKYDVNAVPHIVIEKGGHVLDTVSGSSAAKVTSVIHKYTSESAGADASAAPPKDETADEVVIHGKGAEPEKEEDPAKAKEKLWARLEELVKAAPVMLFMKGKPSEPKCGFSRQLVALLRENSVKYGFFNILEDDDVRQGLKEYAEWPTYPQLWIDGELVGGLDIVKDSLAEDADFLKPYSVNAEAAS